MNPITRRSGPVLLAPDRCTRYQRSTVASRPGRSAVRPRHLLGVWAHPDDEAYLSAALMARTIEAGGRVTLVTLTDGEAGFPADDPRPSEARAGLRRRELTNAMARIGVTDVRFMGLPDGSVARHGAEAVDTIRATIREVSPDVVVTFGPDGITGHDDHVGNWQAVTCAWAETRIGDLWYAAYTSPWLEEWRAVHEELGIWMTGEPDGIGPEDAVLRLELHDAELDRKREVLGEHRSQTLAVATALGEQTYRSWIRQETFRRASQADLLAAVTSEADPTIRGAVVR